MKPEKSENKYIDEWMPPELYNQFKQNNERCIREGKRIEYEEEVSFLSFTQTFNTQLIPLKNSLGRIYRVIVISKDITENKNLNQQITAQNENLKLLNLYWTPKVGHKNGVSNFITPCCSVSVD